MEKEFRINSSLAAFETLSSRLYSNPVLAIIRELSTNANDAHLEAHVDRPFRLHLPTLDEMYFDIRDYGKGIPEDFVYNIYTTFFMSTKTEDDGQTGYFGLGSKTPFSLVDSYKVISYNGGMKKTYEMAKESTGPVVRKLSEEPCGGESGLEICFDIYDSDLCRDFRKEAIEFFKGTTFMPDWNIDSVDMADYAKEKEFYTRDSVKLGSSYRRNISVNVAGVRFDVDMDHLELFEGLLMQMDVKRVNVLAKKNDVTITPSREELHYDQRTKDFITNGIVRAVGNFYEKAKRTINDVPFATLVDYVTKQDCDQTLADMASQRIYRYFMPKCYTSHSTRYSSRASVSAVDTSRVSYNMLQSNQVLLDFSNVKDTVKQKVIMGVLDESSLEGEKIKSDAFKKLLKAITDREGGNITAYVAQPGMLEETARWTGFKIVDWNSVVPEKKPTKKMGFITKSTLSARNGMDNVDHYNKTDLSDGDIGLVALVSPEALNTYYYKDKLYTVSQIVKDTTFYLRPCTENNIENFKRKGFVDIDDFTRKLRESSEYSGMIEQEVKEYLDLKLFNIFFNSFSEDSRDILMRHRYDSLEKYGFFGEMRRCYRKYTNINNYIGNFFTEEEKKRAGNFREGMESAFPMTSHLSYLDTDLENALEYMLAWDSCQAKQSPQESVA